MAYATVDELARALRIAVTTENTPGLQACLDAAAREIDHDIDLGEAVVIPSADWNYSASTAAGDPGSGNFRRNKPASPATTVLSLSVIDAAGVGHDVVVEDPEPGDAVLIARDAPGQWERFALTGAVVDQTTWVELPVEYVSAGAVALDLVDGSPVTIGYLRPTRVGPLGQALVNRVNILRGVEWAKANDAAFGVIGFDQTGALTAPRDGFNRHAYTLTPLKVHWGFA